MIKSIYYDCYADINEDLIYETRVDDQMAARECDPSSTDWCALCHMKPISYAQYCVCDSCIECIDV